MVALSRSTGSWPSGGQFGPVARAEAGHGAGQPAASGRHDAGDGDVGPAELVLEPGGDGDALRDHIAGHAARDGAGQAVSREQDAGTQSARYPTRQGGRPTPVQSKQSWAPVAIRNAWKAMAPPGLVSV